MILMLPFQFHKRNFMENCEFMDFSQIITCYVHWCNEGTNCMKSSWITIHERRLFGSNSQKKIAEAVLGTFLMNGYKEWDDSVALNLYWILERKICWRVSIESKESDMKKSFISRYLICVDIVLIYLMFRRLLIFKHLIHIGK